MSSALFWLDMYHADGLRVDGVASMLCLDYARCEGEWVPNEHGGRDNLEAIHLLRRLNDTVHRLHPDALMIAEESTARATVTQPIHEGGIGFDLKWDMGWMHDTLIYLSQPPHLRKHDHDRICFRMMYAFAEHYVLPLSHDEVVYGKRSLFGRMPYQGEEQQVAHLRLLFGYMYGQPGKKLLFMGDEFGQRQEWNHDRGLDWLLLQHPSHEGLQKWVADLNRLYVADAALHELDCDPTGFRWINVKDAARSVLSFLRQGMTSPITSILVICNFMPSLHSRYRIGVPYSGFWREVLNSDARGYGGRNHGNLGGVRTSRVSADGYLYSLELTLPPLSALFFKHERPDA